MGEPGDRFKIIYKQEGTEGVIIWVDRVTGVNYVQTMAGGGNSGLTVLVDAEGMPIISEDID